MIGGTEQWLFIRGEDLANPVLLWLHGGPGTTSMPMAAHDGSLPEHFTVVHWDQRGAGRSYGVDPSTMTVDQFVADAGDVVRHVRSRLASDHIFLVGHSWGTTLGALTAVRHPELLTAYVGVGHAVNDEGIAVGYDWVLARAAEDGNMEAEQALSALGPPPWDDLDAFRVYGRWVSAFGGTSRAFGMGLLMKEFVTTPLYSLRDVLNFLRGQSFSVSTMISNGEVQAIDLLQDAPRIEVPVLFVQGRHDYNTPGELAREYFDRLDAPAGKRFVWFEESAHFPQWEEPERFLSEMLRLREAVLR
jgi:pimeloyl-ACP methyl ester carboxylesterase